MKKREDKQAPRYTLGIDAKTYKTIENVSSELGCSLAYAAALLVREGQQRRDMDKMVLQAYYDKYDPVGREKKE